MHCFLPDPPDWNLPPANAQLIKNLKSPNGPDPVEFSIRVENGLLPDDLLTGAEDVFVGWSPPFGGSPP